MSIPHPVNAVVINVNQHLAAIHVLLFFVVCSVAIQNSSSLREGGFWLAVQTGLASIEQQLMNQSAIIILSVNI
jgi:hypothetical protein